MEQNVTRMLEQMIEAHSAVVRESVRAHANDNQIIWPACIEQLRLTSDLRAIHKNGPCGPASSTHSAVPTAKKPELPSILHKPEPSTRNITGIFSGLVQHGSSFSIPETHQVDHNKTLEGVDRHPWMIVRSSRNSSHGTVPFRSSTHGLHFNKSGIPNFHKPNHALKNIDPRHHNSRDLAHDLAPQHQLSRTGLLAPRNTSDMSSVTEESSPVGIAMNWAILPVALVVVFFLISCLSYARKFCKRYNCTVYGSYCSSITEIHR